MSTDGLVQPRVDSSVAVFVRACLEDPGGYDRLVLADYLEERGRDAKRLREPGRWIQVKWFTSPSLLFWTEYGEPDPFQVCQLVDGPTCSMCHDVALTYNTVEAAEETDWLWVCSRCYEKLFSEAVPVRTGRPVSSS